MIKEFILPELGENIESAEVVDVLVKEGDTITKNQAVLEIETEKATIEVPSTVEGKITKLNVKAGDKVKVGAIILVVEEINKAPESSTGKSKSESKPEIKTA